MFDDVDDPNLVERAVAKRQGAAVDVGDYVGRGVAVLVGTDRAGAFVLAATEVEGHGDGALLLVAVVTHLRQGYKQITLRHTRPQPREEPLPGNTG